MTNYLTTESGRKMVDSQNEARIIKALTNYREFCTKKLGGYDSSAYYVNQKQAQLSRYIFPGAGLGVGIIGSFAFVHKNSKYIGKCFTLACVFGGYLLSQRYTKSYDIFSRYANYSQYPEDIKKMIDNNDSRYAHQWLKNGFLEQVKL